MEIEHIKKLIENNMNKHQERNDKIRKANNYYANKNDIVNNRNPLSDNYAKGAPVNPLKNADNRISHPWHQLLVDQKAAYAMTVPPSFDVDNKETNDEIEKILGDNYPKVAKDLCINASNAGIAWLHIWRDEEYQNFFRYAVVDSEQIVPIFSKKLNKQLIGLLRTYQDYDDEGKVWVIYEYWSKTTCAVYKHEKDKSLTTLVEDAVFDLIDVGTGEVTGKSNVYEHGWEDIPFIPFRNNPAEQSDLEKYKALIDVYDKVFSGFVNDVDDFQEIIFVLTNYGGQEREEFLKDLKKYKTIHVEDEGTDGGKGGVETLQVEIPIEARKEILNSTRESIFVLGQGVDPQKNIGQNNSGAALKYMYSLLELKASMLETEFKVGFAELVRFILEYSGVDSDVQVKQTWTRTAINNDLEQADIVAKLAPSTSKENIAKANPIVESWEDELSALKKETSEANRMEDDYRTSELDGDEEDDE